jgi:hypothetical protein
MFCGYFGNCIQSYNIYIYIYIYIYMHYERERLREVETCLLCSSLFFMKPHNMVLEPRGLILFLILYAPSKSSPLPFPPLFPISFFFFWKKKKKKKLVVLLLQED